MPEPKAVTPARKSQADIMVQLAEDAELFRTGDDEIFAAFPVREHREVWPVKSTKFRRWLIAQFYIAEGKAPNPQALRSAIDTIEAKAYHEGYDAEVFLRVGEEDGAAYLDLCDEEWRVVEITPDGWQVLTEAPVYFKRARGMLPLPEPRTGESLDLLANFLNVADNDDFMLYSAWTLGVLNPQGPYPILVLGGEQGSAKSTSARLARELIDPNTTPLRSAPKDERDLAITANNSRVIALDNLSRIPEWLSNALCRIATGGGYGTRELYADRDEQLFAATRPIIINSIGNPIHRDDLRDRSLFVSLPPIPERSRRDERTFWAQFREVQPFILGALLDATAEALANRTTTQIDAKPRLADFAVWVTAAEAALEWEQGSFLDVYRENRQSAIEISVEDSKLASLIIDVAEEHDRWEGTATDLLNELNRRVDEQTRRRKWWPKSPGWLSNDLRRAASSLRAVGVEVDFDREPTQKRRRFITITKRKDAENSAQSVQRLTEDALSDATDAILPLLDDYAAAEREAIQSEGA